MKRLIKVPTPLTACFLAVACLTAMGQPQPGQTQPQPKPHELTRFDLTFPGGTPRELVAAIQKSLGRPLNAIVPDDLADVKIPALKMDHINVSELFDSLAVVSQKKESVFTGQMLGQPFGNGYQVSTTSYSFSAVNPGLLTDDSIWAFYVNKPVLPPAPAKAKICRFYSLAPYLDRRYTVDDITTAIETGWKMLGDTSPPTISFHKDTKLLIAVGEPSRLDTIDSALKALETSRPDPAAQPPTPAQKSAEKPKPGQ